MQSEPSAARETCKLRRWRRQISPLGKIRDIVRRPRVGDRTGNDVSARDAVPTDARANGKTSSRLFHGREVLKLEQTLLKAHARTRYYIMPTTRGANVILNSWEFENTNNHSESNRWFRNVKPSTPEAYPEIDVRGGSKCSTIKQLKKIMCQYINKYKRIPIYVIIYWKPTFMIDVHDHSNDYLFDS